MGFPMIGEASFLMPFFELIFIGAAGEVGVITVSVRMVVSSNQSLCILSVVTGIWGSWSGSVFLAFLIFLSDGLSGYDSVLRSCFGWEFNP